MRAPFYPKDIDLLERFVADALKAGDRSGGGHLTVAHYDMEPKLPLITCPTLIIKPTEDPVRCARGREARAAPAARRDGRPAGRDDPGARPAAGGLRPHRRRLPFALMSTLLLSRYVESIGDVDALELDPWELPTGEWGVTVTGENVEYAGKFLYLSEDKRVAAGIERLGPSLLTGTHSGETLYFLKGSILCKPEGGEPYRLKAGRLLLLPARRRGRLGDRGDVREALRHPLGDAAAVLRPSHRDQRSGPRGAIRDPVPRDLHRVVTQTSSRPAT